MRFTSFFKKDKQKEELQLLPPPPPEDDAKKNPGGPIFKDTAQKKRLIKLAQRERKKLLRKILLEEKRDNSIMRKGGFYSDIIKANNSKMNEREWLLNERKKELEKLKRREALDSIDSQFELKKIEEKERKKRENERKAAVQKRREEKFKAELVKRKADSLREMRQRALIEDRKREQQIMREMKERQTLLKEHPLNKASSGSNAVQQNKRHFTFFKRNSKVNSHLPGDGLAKKIPRPNLPLGPSFGKSIQSNTLQKKAKKMNRLIELRRIELEKIKARQELENNEIEILKAANAQKGEHEKNTYGKGIFSIFRRRQKEPDNAINENIDTIAGIAEIDKKAPKVQKAPEVDDTVQNLGAIGKEGTEDTDLELNRLLLSLRQSDINEGKRHQHEQIIEKRRAQKEKDDLVKEASMMPDYIIKGKLDKTEKKKIKEDYEKIAYEKRLLSDGLNAEVEKIKKQEMEIEREIQNAINSIKKKELFIKPKDLIYEEQKLIPKSSFSREYNSMLLMIADARKALSRLKLKKVKKLYNKIVASYNSMPNSDKKSIYPEILSFYQEKAQLEQLLSSRRSSMGRKVVAISDIISEARGMLKVNDLGSARRLYNKAVEGYEKLGNADKAEIYPDILELYNDRKRAESEKFIP